MTGVQTCALPILRIHPDAQPEIKELASAIFRCMNHSTPTLLKWGEWHLPYITKEERKLRSVENLLKSSTARCARVSYSNHDGSSPSFTKDIELHDRLVASRPIHASPCEHQATPAGGEFFFKNFKGWVQYRDRVEQQIYGENDGQ